MLSERQTSIPRPDGAWLYLDEVMHRVLNDYTVMMATVRLAAMQTSDAATGEALGDVIDRLNGSAKAFRALTPPGDQSLRELDEELESLCAALSTSGILKKGIELAFVGDPVCVTAQRSWKIRLVVSELVANAARHAFLDYMRGSIEVRLAVQADTIRCIVADNGSASLRIKAGRGSGILDAIAAELGGTLFRHHTSLGSKVELELPLFDPAERDVAHLIRRGLHGQQ
jgi:two-component sensor histidine kinase